MLAHGDVESVNLRTGERCHRVAGNGESRLESDAFWLWRKWAERREKETMWRRELSGTPGNMAIDQFMFTEGFKQGAAWALLKKAAEEVAPVVAKEREGERITTEIMDFRMK